MWWVISIVLLLFSLQVMSDSLQPHELQHTRLPNPSPSPRVCPSSCPMDWWCHPTISSSATLLPFGHQSFPASGSFPMSQLFASGAQSIGAFHLFATCLFYNWAPLIAQLVKNLPVICSRPWFNSGSGRSTGKGIGYPLQYSWAFLVAQLVKNPPALQETWAQSWVRKIPWREEQLPTPVLWSGGLHGLRSPWGRRVRHN